MGDRFPTAMVTVAIAAAVLSAAISGFATETSAQAALSTPWGEPDLQGIWT
jgi:type IV secretory pathway VirB2 component (pilin)